MTEITLIRGTDISAWMVALKLCKGHDIYHLPQYHLLAEKMGEGISYLFLFKFHDNFAALPFLLRSVSDAEGLDGSKYNDITSVYGYPGILASLSIDSQFAEDFRRGFQTELLRLFKELSVVAFFSRTNPLLPNTWILDGVSEVIPLSTTIAVDLSKSDKEQLSIMTKGLKYDIRKARKSGVVVEEDISFQYIDDFIQIYNETMNRNRADIRYYFPKYYYLQLKEELGESIRLYFARCNGLAISASMFFTEGNIIQYHLSGSLSNFFHLNGAKIILDEVRQWGTKNGFSWLHLGGGVGSSEDSLFHFKAGFSKIRLPFQIARTVVDHDVYSELTNKRRKWANKNKLAISETNFFPNYRKPTLPEGGNQR